MYKETLAAGKYTQTTPFSGNNNLSGLLGIDGSGSLYFSANGLSASMVKETPAGGQYFQTPENGYPGGSLPSCFAVDGGGNFYSELGYYDDGFPIYKYILDNGIYEQSTILNTTKLLCSGGNNGGEVAVDASENLYFAPPDSGELYKATLANGQYTLAELASGFSRLAGVALDGDGNIYVVDIGYKASPAVYRFTLSTGVYTKVKIGSGWIAPQGIAVDHSGNVYVSDVISSASNAQAAVYKIDLSTPPSLSFGNDATGKTSSPQTVSVANIGNEPMVFSALTYPKDFPEASGVKSDCTARTSVSPRASCTLSVEFKPTAPITSGSSLKLSEDVVLTTNTLNKSTAQKIPVYGTETIP